MQVKGVRMQVSAAQVKRYQKGRKLSPHGCEPWQLLL